MCAFDLVAPCIDRVGQTAGLDRRRGLTNGMRRPAQIFRTCRLRCAIKAETHAHVNPRQPQIFEAAVVMLPARCRRTLLVAVTSALLLLASGVAALQSEPAHCQNCMDGMPMDGCPSPSMCGYAPILCVDCMEGMAMPSQTHSNTQQPSPQLWQTTRREQQTGTAVANSIEPVICRHAHPLLRSVFRCAFQCVPSLRIARASIAARWSASMDSRPRVSLSIVFTPPA